MNHAMTRDHRAMASGIGERIRRARIAAEVTQADLSVATDVNRSTIANIEVGHQNATVTTLLAIAARLGVTVAALIGEQPLNLPPRVRVSSVGWIVRCDECGLVDACDTKALAEAARIGHLNGTHNVPAPQNAGPEDVAHAQ